MYVLGLKSILTEYSETFLSQTLRTQECKIPGRNYLGDTNLQSILKEGQGSGQHVENGQQGAIDHRIYFIHCRQKPFSACFHCTWLPGAVVPSLSVLSSDQISILFQILCPIPWYPCPNSTLLVAISKGQKNNSVN